MAATVQAAWAAGCSKAMLMAGSKRPSTHGFYRSSGFSADEKTGYIARPGPALFSDTNHVSRPAFLARDCDTSGGKMLDLGRHVMRAYHWLGYA